MKILVFAHSESYTGANIVLLQNIERFKTFARVEVVCIEDGVLVRELAKMNIPCHIIRQRWWSINSGNFRSLLSLLFVNLLALIKTIILYLKFKPDVAYTNTITISVGAIVGKLFKTKHFWHLHEFGVEDHNFDFLFGQKFTYKLIGNLSYRVLTVSNAIKNKCVSMGIPNNKIITVYNIPKKLSAIKKNRSLDTSRPVKLICVGRYSPGKNFEDAIEACSYLKEAIPFRLDIYGGINNKKYYNELVSLIQKLGLEDCVVIDGGSTDGSIDVIRRFEGTVTCWVSEKDSGIYNAMNKGIAKATGRYVIFMNSGDTFYAPDTLQKVVDSMGNHDIVYGNAWVVDSGNSWLEVFPPKLSLAFMASRFLCHQAIFYRLDVLKALGGYNEEYRIFADWDFNVRAMFIEGYSHSHVDVTVCRFDRMGVSSTSPLIKEELLTVKKALLPAVAWQELEDAYKAQRKLQLLRASRLLRLISRFSVNLKSTLYR